MCVRACSVLSRNFCCSLKVFSFHITHICMYVCIRECMYVCMYVRMYVCTYSLCMFACMLACFPFGTRDWTQGLVCAKHMPYYRATRLHSMFRAREIVSWVKHLLPSLPSCVDDLSWVSRTHVCRRRETTLESCRWVQ